MKNLPDWIAIEGEYRAGVDALRTIADRHGVTEGAIRARAKKSGWVRDAAKTKRKVVADRMAGVTQEITQDVMRNILGAAGEDVADMQCGLRIQRKCLIALEQATETVKEPREIKIIVDATSSAIASIRNIRGLDEPVNQQGSNDDDDARAMAIAGRLESINAAAAA